MRMNCGETISERVRRAMGLAIEVRQKHEYAVYWLLNMGMMEAATIISRKGISFIIHKRLKSRLLTDV